MKSFFVCLESRGVTGATRGNEILKLKKIIAYRDTPYVILPVRVRSPKGNSILPPYSPEDKEGVTLKEGGTLDVTLGTPVTPDDNYFHSFFEERAGIYQFEAGHLGEEAERLAYKDVLLHFVREKYPVVIAEFNQCIRREI